MPSSIRSPGPDTAELCRFPKNGTAARNTAAGILYPAGGSFTVLTSHRHTRKWSSNNTDYNTRE